MLILGRASGTRATSATIRLHLAGFAEFVESYFSLLS